MEKANVVEQNIAKRRSIKPDKYTGGTLDESTVQRILNAANWAPTHGYTEPWRFVVFTGEGKKALQAILTQLDEEDHGRNEIREQKLAERLKTASHIIAIGMKRGENEKIPFIEEAQSVAMAVQNMWLTAASLNVGAYWSTGAIGYDPRLTKALGWNSERDSAMGFLFLGEYAQELPEGRRLTEITEKVRWVRS